MNKRQRKKKMKKYLPIIADEANLLTMTDNEREQAFKDYENYKEKFAYKKNYKNFKEGKPLHYFFPVSQRLNDFLTSVSSVARGTSNTIKVTQTMNDFIQK